jgi:hypothetical protein
MLSVKESLKATIDLLSDEEVRSLWKAVQQRRSQYATLPTLSRLSNDPGFSVPVTKAGRFRRVRPIRGEGIAASRLLAEDRQ